MLTKTITSNGCSFALILLFKLIVKNITDSRKMREAQRRLPFFLKRLDPPAFHRLIKSPPPLLLVNTNFDCWRPFSKWRRIRFIHLNSIGINRLLTGEFDKLWKADLGSSRNGGGYFPPLCVVTTA